MTVSGNADQLRLEQKGFMNMQNRLHCIPPITTRVLCCAVLFLAIAAQAGNIQASAFDTFADAMVNEGDPDTNYGDFELLRVGGQDDPATLGLEAAAGRRHSYVGFDVSDIPAGATVTGVLLEAVQTDGATVGEGFDVFEAAGSWSENTVTWSSAPGAAGGALFNTGQLPGNSNGGKYLGLNPANLKSTVQGWVDNPDSAHGLIFQLGNNEANAGGDTFAAREHAAPTTFDEPQPVRLTVSYAEAGESADNPWVSQVAYSDASTDVYLGSPSIVRAPNGDLLASHDYFGPNAPDGSEADMWNTSSLYRSTDEGQSWTKTQDMAGQFWANLFVHDDSLYMMGTDERFGSVVIRRSKDNGETWTTPADASSGLLLPDGANDNYATGPMPVAIKDGRIYRVMENRGAAPFDFPEDFATFMMSAPLSEDLLDADNWSVSNEVPFDPSWTGTHVDANGWLEGNAIEAPNGEIWNVMRVAGAGKAAVLKLDTNTMTLSFDPDTGFIDLPGGETKFTIRRDPKTGLYVALVNDNQDPAGPLQQRNVLSLAKSEDLVNWEIVEKLLVDDLETDWDTSVAQTGFQYVDWQFDGDNILYLSRTAYDGADNRHDSNRITYHVLEDYESVLTAIPEPGAGSILLLALGMGLSRRRRRSTPGLAHAAARGMRGGCAGDVRQ